MNVVADLPADAQAAEPVQVGERALHDPALGAESGAVLGGSVNSKKSGTSCAKRPGDATGVRVHRQRRHLIVAPGRERYSATASALNSGG
jgi:hypothetical protein